MPSKKTTLTIGFLAVTALAVLMELVFAFDGNASTVPWTDLLIEYVPQEVTATAVAVLAAWLPVHFASRYPKRWPGGEPTSARRKHIATVVAAGLVALQSAVSGDRVTSAEWALILTAVATAWGVYGVRNKPVIHPGGLVRPAGRSRSSE